MEENPSRTPGSLVSRCYVAFAKALGAMPDFRGKVRAGLAVHKWLGLANRPLLARANLRKPVRYRAELNLSCPHERMALLMGGYEWDTSTFLARCYPGRGYVLDVGANVGLIAIPLAIALPTVQVWCIEPGEGNSRALRSSAALNGLENRLRLIECCAGESDGAGHLGAECKTRSGASEGNANVVYADSPMAKTALEVSMKRIDSLITEGTLPADCSLVKMDCEGYEYRALRGAVSLLTGSRPVIYGEFNDYCMRRYAESRADLLQFVAPLRYLPYSRRGNSPMRFVPYDRNSADEDVLLLPREKVKQLAWCLE